MNRRWCLRAFAVIATTSVVGCSQTNSNEANFPKDGHVDPNIPADAEEYEKKFGQKATPAGKGKRREPTEI